MRAGGARAVPIVVIATIRSQLVASALLCAVLCVGVTDPVRAQGLAPTPVQKAAQGGFPDATFDVKFRKYTPPGGALSPYYSWDARMAMDLTVSRVGKNAVKVLAIFESVGTENIGARVTVGGTGYVIRASYTRTLSPDVSLSAGVSHLSTHLTRDLDEKTNGQRANGLPIPHVPDADEYNAVYVAGHRRFATWRFTPEVDVILQPKNFRFDGSRSAYLRPLYVTTRWTLWTRGQTSLTAESAHEFGRRSWTEMGLFLGLYARGQAEGRFQLFASASPGHGLRTSPHQGSVRDGIACGVRMVFASIP